MTQKVKDGRLKEPKRASFLANARIYEPQRHEKDKG